jgi:hypothetical protein
MPNTLGKPPLDFSLLAGLFPNSSQPPVASAADTPAAAVPTAASAPFTIPRARAPIFPVASATGSVPAPASAAAPTTSPADPSIPNPLTNHAATLMALGAGIAQGGIGKGLAMASAAAEAERNRQAQQLSLAQTYKALTDGGIPQEEALAAVLNPGLMRTLAAKYLGPKAQKSAEPARDTPSPPVPKGVPEGASYSPAKWTAPDGSAYDSEGNPTA